MVPCDRFQTLLWEDQFGLLEASEREGLRQHLAACSDCQSERVKAETGYLRLAQASRLEVVVPVFKAPDPDSVPIILAREPVRLREARRWSSRPWMAAAAAVLLAVGVLYGIYYQGLAGREAAFQSAEQAVKDLMDRRANLQGEAENEARKLVAQNQASQLRVQVLGPAAYQVEDQNQYQVLASDLAGTPADVRVKARLVDASGRMVGDVHNVSGSGEVLLSMGPHASVQSLTAARLEIEAQGLDKNVKLQTQIPVLGPSYVTHLAVDKRIYRPGERVFFRSVTLKRFDLKPPGRNFNVTYALMGPRGALLASQSGLTRPEDGIGSWVFTIPAECPDGEYTLSVTETEKRFPPVKRQLQVRRDLAKEQAPAAGAAGQLFVEFYPEGGDLVRDAPQRVYFRVHDGSGQPVELAGSLVDSAGNDVASLQTNGGEGQPVLCRGLGVFTLRPRLRGPFKLRITSPAGIANPIEVPVRGPGRAEARTSLRTKTVRGNQPLEIILQELSAKSVGLAVPTGVTRADEPLLIRILSNRSVQPMVVGVFCRGRLVAEKAVWASWGQTEVRLTPAADAQGILRVTLFQAERDHLEPVAERLVYRRPAKRLNLSLAAQEEKYSPGQKVRLRIRSTDEKANGETAWLLVSVANQDALGQGNMRGQGLPAYFHLGTELEEAADLEDAELLVGDDQRSALALDLFLGTQGWRRIIEPDSGALLAQNQAPGQEVPRAAVGLLKLDNLNDVEPTYKAEVDKGLASLQAALAAKSRELTVEGERWHEEARKAAEKLNDFRARAAEYVRLGIGSGTLATLTTGCILLSVAAVRLVRRRRLYRPYLAGAFAALLLCLIIYAPRTNRLQGNDQTSELTKVERLRVSLDKVAQDRQVLEEAVVQPPIFREPRIAALDRIRRRVEQASALAYRPDQAIAKQDRGVIPQIEKGKPEDFKRPPFIGIVPRPQGPGPFPLRVREYAYDLKKPLPPAHPAMPTTLLWKPVLISAADGTARVEFDLPKNAAIYRIRVEGHTSSGRLGSLQRVLEVR